MDLLSASTSPSLGPLLSAGPSSSRHGSGSVHGLSDADLALDGSLLVGPALARAHSDSDAAHSHLAANMLDLDDHTDSHAHAHEHHHMHHHSDAHEHEHRHEHSHSHSSHGHSGHGHSHRHDSHDDPLSSLDAAESISMDIGMDIGLMTDTTGSSTVDNSSLMQSTSPLLLSAAAPLIGDFMPGMSLGDLSMGNGADAPASKVAAAALVHNQIESLEVSERVAQAMLRSEVHCCSDSGRVLTRAHLLVLLS